MSLIEDNEHDRDPADRRLRRLVFRSERQRGTRTDQRPHSTTVARQSRRCEVRRQGVSELRIDYGAGLSRLLRPAWRSDRDFVVRRRQAEPSSRYRARHCPRKGDLGMARKTTRWDVTASLKTKRDIAAYL